METIQEIKNSILEKLKGKQIIGITQEGNIIIGWYNDEIGNTKCLMEEIYSDKKNICSI